MGRAVPPLIASFDARPCRLFFDFPSTGRRPRVHVSDKYQGQEPCVLRLRRPPSGFSIGARSMMTAATTTNSPAMRTAALTALLFSLAATGRAATTPTQSITSATSLPSITLATSVASAPIPLASTIPSQAALPPTQPWCPSSIFCAGEVRAYMRLPFVSMLILD
jgi:hypothetical protein